MNNREIEEYIEWNSLLCQLCFSNRCGLKSYPEFKKYCSICAPDDEGIMIFVIGAQAPKKRIITTRERVKEMRDSIFSFILDAPHITHDDNVLRSRWISNTQTKSRGRSRVWKFSQEA